MPLSLIDLTGCMVYRRRAHLVVWDESLVVTVAPFDLYWCPRELCTFARITEWEGEGLWLPVRDLIGHWQFFTGCIAGARILDGYEGDMPYPKCCQIWPSCEHDPDTGKRFWRSDRGRLLARLPQPMAHT